MSDTQEHKLRAMADGYSKFHLWDHLDAETCRNAADEIQRLRNEINQQNEVIYLYAEKQFTTAPTADTEHLAILSVAELLKRAGRDSDSVSCFVDGADWSDAGAMALIVKPGQAKAVHDLLVDHGFITPGKPVDDSAAPGTGAAA